MLGLLADESGRPELVAFWTRSCGKTPGGYSPSTVATVRMRTHVTSGPGSRAASQAMGFKPIQANSGAAA
jgi:hypothetical protein